MIYGIIELVACLFFFLLKIHTTRIGIVDQSYLIGLANVRVRYNNNRMILHRGQKLTKKLTSAYKVLFKKMFSNQRKPFILQTLDNFGSE